MESSKRIQRGKFHLGDAVETFEPERKANPRLCRDVKLWLERVNFDCSAHSGAEEA